MNWLYDHLRFVPRYVPTVLCETLLNRDEFPELEARCFMPKSLTRRLWRRIVGNHLYPTDAWWLRKKMPCILHSHFGYVAKGDLTMQRAYELPWVVSFYGADVYQLGRLPEWQQVYDRVFDRATQVLALGPVMKAHLEQLGCSPRKIVVHPLGVDVENLPSRPRVLQPNQPLRILYAGTFREKKGIQYVIEAAALARRSGARFELTVVGDASGKAGDQETKEEVFRRIGHLGLGDVVTHHPFLRFQDLLDLALRSHIFVAPSVTAADGDAEGTPFVLQQMMATGMPAIATVHSDIPYLFGEYEHLLVPERDARAIADRLQRYMDEPNTLVSDGMALRDRMLQAFNVRRCAAHLSELYDVVQ